jgi:hypothetical protein
LLSHRIWLCEWSYTSILLIFIPLRLLNWGSLPNSCRFLLCYAIITTTHLIHGFYTNTFDILYCFEKSLTFIECAAFHYNKGETLVFPFEVTFWLFLGVVIASGIKNW